MPTNAAEEKNDKIPVLINFKGRIDPTILEANVQSLEAQGGEIKYEYTIVNAVAAELPQKAIDALSKNPNIDFIEPDYEIQLMEADDLAQADEIPWGISKINAINAQYAGFTGKGIKIAVLDTGIDYNHPDLKANYIGGYDFVNADNYPMDDHGHGTHVAGTIAALSNGVGVIGAAPQAQLYAVKVVSSSGSASYSNLIAGIDWAINNNADVITMSLGGTAFSSTLQNACDNAYSKGIILVGAAGNSGSAVVYPAAYDSVIAVSAIDSTDTITSWSCYGSEIELTAPGVNIKSTTPGGFYEYMNGTSMATPHVTGTIALMLSSKVAGTSYDLNNNGKWDPAEIRSRLQSTATDLGASGKDDYYGYGVVNAYAAVKGLVPIDDNLPVANAGVDKTATVGSALNFDGSSSTDDKGIISYSWDFDESNGITSEATTMNATKTYTSEGTYTVTLTVTDTAGQKATDTLQVVISSPITTVLHTPTYDNRLRSDTPTTVLSTTSYLDIGKSTAIARDIMMFDLSSYKTNDTVSKATLSLYWYYPAGKTRTSDTVVEVYRPMKWDPKYVSWKSNASEALWSTAGGCWYDKNEVSQGTTPYATITFPASTVPSNKYYDFDVTQLVQEYVSGKYRNTGFFLKAKTESGNYIALYSSEYSNAAMKPKLTVTIASGSTSVDNPPIANAGADKTAIVGTAVTFDGSSSTDDKGIESYSWDFDASNGITADATTNTASKTYTETGNYTVTLTVIDTAGQKATDTLQIVVISPTSETSYTPTYDNRLRSDTPTTVLSTTNYLDIGKSTAIARDVMIFDLSSYKITDTISKATLSLYWYYPAGKTRTSDTIVEIYRPVEWDQKYVTWNSRTAGILWSAVGGNWYDKIAASQGTTPYSSVIFPADMAPDNKYYDFDVTQLVQEYISGKYKNTGFFIKAKTESGNYISFYSSEYSNAAMRPKLTVTTASGSIDRSPVLAPIGNKTAYVNSLLSFTLSATDPDGDKVTYSATELPTGAKLNATTGTFTWTPTATGKYSIKFIATANGQTDDENIWITVTTTAENTVPYVPTNDNQLRESSPSSVLSSSSYIDIGKSTYRCRGVMMFDLNNYKTTDEISKATLSLYWYYPAGKTRTSDTIVEVYRPVEWDTKYVTWNSRASGTLWSTAGGSWYDKNAVSQGTTPYASVTFPAGTVPDNKYYEFDVTQLVKEYISGKYRNTGFFLKAKTESENYIAFYSSDYSNAVMRPKLTITS
nr:disaggregatase related repeat-containing protein [uncultured Methanomethylovorans sp.]